MLTTLSLRLLLALPQITSSVQICERAKKLAVEDGGVTGLGLTLKRERWPNV